MPGVRQQIRASNRDWNSSCKISGDPNHRASQPDRRRSTLSHKILAGLAACAITAPYGAGAQQAAEDWQAIDALTATVANALGRTATPIDRRIKLARCPEQDRKSTRLNSSH